LTNNYVQLGYQLQRARVLSADSSGRGDAYECEFMVTKDKRVIFAGQRYSLRDPASSSSSRRRASSRAAAVAAPLLSGVNTNSIFIVLSIIFQKLSSRSAAVTLCGIVENDGKFATSIDRLPVEQLADLQSVSVSSSQLIDLNQLMNIWRAQTPSIALPLPSAPPTPTKSKKPQQRGKKRKPPPADEEEEEKDDEVADELQDEEEDEEEEVNDDEEAVVVKKHPKKSPKRPSSSSSSHSPSSSSSSRPSVPFGGVNMGRYDGYGPSIEDMIPRSSMSDEELRTRAARYQALQAHWFLIAQTRPVLDIMTRPWDIDEKALTKEGEEKYAEYLRKRQILNQTSLQLLANAGMANQPQLGSPSLPTLTMPMPMLSSSAQLSLPPPTAMPYLYPSFPPPPPPSSSPFGSMTSPFQPPTAYHPYANLMSPSPYQATGSALVDVLRALVRRDSLF
jgi:hypothetical protein